MIPHFRSRSFTLLAAAALLLAGCSKKANQAVQNDEGEPAANAPLVSSLRMNAPSAKEQLTKGVYQLEAGLWRWTSGNFTITLKTPPGAAQKGATLTLNLSASDPILQQVHSQSLTAAVGSKTLKTEKYVDPGAHTFTADVPASLLTGDTVAIDFSLDNSLPPGPTDRRELGIIISGVSLDSN
ncbi:MAG TPA: hypothetical protein VHA14_02630 [Bryobacteraceae bacterium]|nr:hypothetical protein [Bryobacteraceae bacterium]